MLYQGVISTSLWPYLYNKGEVKAGYLFHCRQADNSGNLAQLTGFSSSLEILSEQSLQSS